MPSDIEDTARRWHLQARKKALAITQPCWLLDLELSSLQNCENINVCCLNCPVCGILLCQPKLTRQGPTPLSPDMASLMCYLLLFRKAWVSRTQALQMEAQQDVRNGSQLAGRLHCYRGLEQSEGLHKRAFGPLTSHRSPEPLCGRPLLSKRRKEPTKSEGAGAGEQPSKLDHKPQKAARHCISVS